MATLDELKDQLALVMIAFGDGVRDAVKDVPDDRLHELVAMCQQKAKPDESKNFPIPLWGEVAKEIEDEFWLRYHFRRAEELGFDVYCVACAGECRGHDDT